MDKHERRVRTALDWYQHVLTEMPFHTEESRPYALKRLDVSGEALRHAVILAEANGVRCV